ncbi:enoyl-CoA hydratase/isomerase family protein [Streptomyces sp. M19]
MRRAGHDHRGHRRPAARPDGGRGPGARAPLRSARGAENSRFRLPELALGLPAAWGGCLPRLLHEVGAARIRELLLTGESFDAVQAERMAVLHRVVPESELDAVVDRWTRPVLRRSASALRVTKAMLNSYASTSRQADATLLDSELLYSVLAADRLSDRR